MFHFVMLEKYRKVDMAEKFDQVLKARDKNNSKTNYKQCRSFMILPLLNSFIYQKKFYMSRDFDG